MYEILRIPGPDMVELTADKLKIGDLADVMERGFDNVIVLKTYTGLVALSDPNQTWAGSHSLKVRKLPKGTVLQLRVRD